MRNSTSRPKKRSFSTRWKKLNIIEFGDKSTVNIPHVAVLHVDIVGIRFLHVTRIWDLKAAVIA